MDNIERVRKIVYALDSEELGYVRLSTEPMGWGQDSKSWKRDTDSKSIPAKVDINLEFFGDGATYLRQLYDAFGAVRCRLLKYKVSNTLTEELKLDFVQEIDLTSYSRNHTTGGVTVEATDGGLFKDITSRIDEEYDLISDVSADGVYIGDLNTYNLDPEARDIFRYTLLEADNAKEFVLKSGRWADNTADAYAGIPMEIINNNSHGEDAKDVTVAAPDSSQGGHNMNNTIGTPQRVGDQFFLQADRELTVNLKFSLSVLVTDVDLDDASDLLFKIQLRTSIGQDIELTKIEDLTTYENAEHLTGNTINIDFEREINIKEGESLALVYYSYGDYGGFLDGSNNHADYYLKVLHSRLEITDSTPFEATSGKCITMFDAFNRLSAKITGRQNVVRSSVFGEGGEFEDIVLDVGFWARGFPNSYIDEETKEERKIQFVTSWADCFEAAQYIMPLTWFVKVEGNEEIIYIEDARFTQNDFVGVDLGEVDDVDTQATPENFFKSLSFGMSQEIDYEELNGLDEPNGKISFSTYRERAEQIYTALTPYRIDPTGYELIRRKPFKDYSTEDTSRDEHIWMHDAKKTATGFTHKKWQDVGTQPPTGIFSPDSFWNIRLSPANRMLYGHSYAFNTALFHFPNKKIIFKSSNCNSELTTFVNGRALKESENIIVKDLDPPTIVPKKITLSFTVTDEKVKQLEGFTSIEKGGEFIQVPNVFGQVKATFKNETYYGRIVEVQTADEGTAQLIEIFV